MAPKPIINIGSNSDNCGGGSSSITWDQILNKPACIRDCDTLATYILANLPILSVANTGNILLDLSASKILSSNLTETEVTPGAYGSVTNIPAIVIDAYGRITSATDTEIQIEIAQVSNLQSALDTLTASLTPFTGYNDTADIDFDNTAFTAILTTSGVTGGIYGDAGTVGQFTVDTKGRVTSALDVAINILSSQVSDFDAAVNAASAGMFLPISGGTMSGTIILTGDPVDVNDAVNKHYVDTLFATVSVDAILNQRDEAQAGDGFWTAGPGTVTDFLEIKGDTTDKNWQIEASGNTLKFYLVSDDRITRTLVASLSDAGFFKAKDDIGAFETL